MDVGERTEVYEATDAGRACDEVVDKAGEGGTGSVCATGSISGFGKGVGRVFCRAVLELTKPVRGTDSAVSTRGEDIGVGNRLLTLLGVCKDVDSAEEKVEEEVIGGDMRVLLFQAFGVLCVLSPPPTASLILASH